MTDLPPKEAIKTRDIVESIFGDSVAGIYLFGSAVAGGLQADSDVDVLAALDRGTTFDERKTLVNRLTAVSGKVGSMGPARPIELTVVSIPDVVPWRFPPSAEFVYGEWLRQEFEAGMVPEPGSDPDLAIVLKKVADTSFVLAGNEASAWLDPIGADDIRNAIRGALPDLLSGIRGDERNVILTLARMWFTALSGQIVSKDAAAEWAEHRLPDEPSALLRKARLAYLGRITDDWSGQQARVDALARVLRQSVEACLDAGSPEMP